MHEESEKLLSVEISPKMADKTAEVTKVKKTISCKA
jgi:hypothetical protein